MGELEKLGPRYRIALRIARDERWERLKCDHKGVYADEYVHTPPFPPSPFSLILFLSSLE